MKANARALLLLASTKVVLGSRSGKSAKLPDSSMPAHAIFARSKSAKAKSPQAESNMVRSPCVDQEAPAFVIDNDQDIGDPLFHDPGGPGFVKKCGSDCYTVKDNGDDPPYDPELGDTLRFAYKKVTSDSFSIRSRVCGVECAGKEDWNEFLSYGRTGLMVRDALDPFARNVFVSHSPYGQADWSYRKTFGGDSFEGFDGSPDVECLWITLTRDGNKFEASYAYPKDNNTCGLSQHDLNLNFEVDMPETVYAGLAVSTAVSPPYCAYTEANFNDIECRGCS